MKIAHLSDFHARRHVQGHPAITRRRARRMPDLLERVIDEIRLHQPDVLAVTGDLVDTPFYGMKDPACLARTRQDLQLIRDVIDPIGCPVLYLFGNHDDAGTFHDVFGDQNPDTTIGGYRFISFYDEEVTDHFAERLGGQRERFLRVLADSDQTPQIHLQHYMVWPENNKGYPHSYREAVDLHDRILASGKVRLSLSGHYHGGVDAFEEAGTWFATSRAFCESPHPYRIYDIDGSALAQTEYTVGAEPIARVLFLEGVRLLELANDNTAFRSALASAKEDGWTLIGIGADSDLAGHPEKAWDAQVGALSDSGLELTAAARVPDSGKIAGAVQNISEALGFNLASSRALVLTGSDHAVDRSGTPAFTVTPETAVAALIEATAS